MHHLFECVVQAWMQPTCQVMVRLNLVDSHKITNTPVLVHAMSACPHLGTAREKACYSTGTRLRIVPKCGPGYRTDVARREGTPSPPTLCWALDMDPELCSDPPRIDAWLPSRLGSNSWTTHRHDASCMPQPGQFRSDHTTFMSRPVEARSLPIADNR